MFLKKTIGAILLMGGKGSRFGHPIPKQFLPLNGKPVYLHALDRLRQSNLFDEIILVCPCDWPIAETGVTIVAGGETRQQSSYAGLKAFTGQPDIVLIHDAVRPFVSQTILEENLSLAIQHGAVDTCIPSADTIVHAPHSKSILQIPNRAEFLRGQTPQTFRFDWIVQAHQRAIEDQIIDCSDDCQLILRLGFPVQIAQGSESNFKITTSFDLLIATHLSSEKQTI